MPWLRHHGCDTCVGNRNIEDVLRVTDVELTTHVRQTLPDLTACLPQVGHCRTVLNPELMDQTNGLVCQSGVALPQSTDGQTPAVNGNVLATGKGNGKVTIKGAPREMPTSTKRSATQKTSRPERWGLASKNR